MIPINQIVQGDAKEVLSAFPNGSINCCITSPPYWALRDYGIEGQLGLEPTFEEYIDKLCDIYGEVKRVLRPDGTCWVNLGDTYNSPGSHSGGLTGDFKHIYGKALQDGGYTNITSKQLPAKSLCLIPQRFAIEMVNRGWILRNVIIWHKPNPMPSSAKDRFTVDFEYVFFFVKSKKYWFEPQYEPQSETSHPRYAQGLAKPPKARPNSKELNRPGYENWREKTPIHKLPLGRNKRTVWTIPTQSFAEAHFATFPEKLVEPMIKAGCPEFVCKKCGKGREKVYHTQYVKDSNRDTNKTGGLSCPAGLGLSSSGHNNMIFKGYTDCGCNAGWRPGVCLDMFRRFWDCGRSSRPAAA